MRAAFAGNRMLKLGIALILPFAICALIPGLIAPHPPDLTLAAPLLPPSGQYLLGTDEVGRDLLSRVIYAARVDLGISVSATVLATVVGSAIGLFAGYRGHAWDSIVMRSTDVLLAFPSILLAIFVLTIFGRTELVLIIALAILFVPGFIRLSRGLAVGIRESAFVSASEISGGHSLHVIRRHILPNASGPLLVGASLTAATSLLAESSLSYLGLGLPPPTPSWGNML
jgi:peptide/nickel transport system permease protein